MGLVIAVSGLPAAGKGEFATILSNNSIPVVSMGDMVRAEVRKRGIPEEPSVFGRVATEMRAEFGDDIIAQRLVQTVDGLLEDNPIVLIEGLRGTAERDVFSLHWGDKFLIVAITASLELRFQRVQSRGRSEDGSLDDLLARDEREKGWGLGEIIDQADKTFPNEADLENLEELVSDWLSSL
jgi:dephospho-CoA kinase